MWCKEIAVAPCTWHIKMLHWIEMQWLVFDAVIVILLMTLEMFTLYLFSLDANTMCTNTFALCMSARYVAVCSLKLALLCLHMTLKCT